MYFETRHVETCRCNVTLLAGNRNARRDKLSVGIVSRTARNSADVESLLVSKTALSLLV